jgi:surfactin synthase thioesterase subunit
MSNPSLMRRPGPGRSRRLFCFDCAGGNSLAFLSWQDRVDPSLEICAVQLPGRGARVSEAPSASMNALIKALAAAIAPVTDRPFAFFGHSLGGLLAFELARHCRLRYMPTPEHLFVAGCGAPRLRDAPERALHTLPDDELVEALRDYNGTPPELLGHRELMTMVLPAIRADFSLVETYEYRASLPLPLPVTVLAGRADPHVTTAQVEGWRTETNVGCRVEWFDGDHFFLHPQRDAVVECVARSWPMPAPPDPARAPSPSA